MASKEILVLGYNVLLVRDKDGMTQVVSDFTDLDIDGLKAELDKIENDNTEEICNALRYIRDSLVELNKKIEDYYEAVHLQK